MYKCKYFDIRELVSPEVHRLKGDRCWRFFSPIALKGLDKLREKYGPITINNWHIGGDRKFSGFHLKGEYNRSEFHHCILLRTTGLNWSQSIPKVVFLHLCNRIR